MKHSTINLNSFFFFFLFVLISKMTFGDQLSVAINASPRICTANQNSPNTFHIEVSDITVSNTSFAIGIQNNTPDLTFSTPTSTYLDNNSIPYNVYDLTPQCSGCPWVLDFDVTYGCTYPIINQQTGVVTPIDQNFILLYNNGSGYQVYPDVLWSWQWANDGSGDNPYSSNYIPDYYLLVEQSTTQHTVPGHAGQTVTRAIHLKNNGSIDFDGDFYLEDIFTCDVLNLDKIELFKNSILPANLIASSATNTISKPFSSLPASLQIHQNDEIIILETFTITFDNTIAVGHPYCLTNNCTNSTILYRWGCCGTENPPDTRQYTVTRYGNPHLEWKTVQPTPSNDHCGYWDLQCHNGDQTTWIYELENKISGPWAVGDTASAFHLVLTLSNAAPFSGFYLINQGDVHCTYIPNPVTGQPQQIISPNQIGLIMNFPNDPHLDCTTPNSITSMGFGYQPAQIPPLHPGDKYRIEFITNYCCTAADNIDNSNNQLNLLDNPVKFFNTWSILQQFNVECPGGGYSGPAISTNTCVTPHGNEGYFDGITFRQDFTPSISNLVGPIGACATTPADFIIDNTQLILANKNANLFCNTYDVDANNMNMTVQLKLSFKMKPHLKLGPFTGNEIYLEKDGIKWYPNSFTSANEDCPVLGPCDDREYDAVFLGSDLYSILPQCNGCTSLTLKQFRDFMNGSTTSFSLMPCCCCATANDDLHTPYSVETYISGRCADCWIPIGRIKRTINVQCPGCVFPGIQVGISTMNRKTYGLVDADNNGLVDVPSTPIDDNYASAHPEIRLNRSIQGDVLETVTTGGYFTGGGTGGMSYSDLVTQGITCSSTDCVIPNGDPFQFNHLYFDQTIPYSNAADFNLNLLSCDVYLNGSSIAIPQNIGTGGVLQSHIGDQFLFHFVPSDLGVDFSPSASGFSSIKVVNKYQVCKNHLPADPLNQDPSANRFESESFNAFYFSIIPQTDPVFGHLQQAGETGGCTNNATCNCLCNKIFQCGTGGNFHYFYSIHTNNITGYSDLVDWNYCHKAFICRAVSNFGGLVGWIPSYPESGSGLNVFPYEFRPAPLAHSFQFNVPTGYTIATNSNWHWPTQLYTEFTTYGCSTSGYQLVRNNNVTIPTSPPYIVNLNLVNADDNYLSLPNASLCTSDENVTPGPGLNGDEFTRTNLYFELIPDCQTTPSSYCISDDQVAVEYDDYSTCTSPPHLVYRICSPYYCAPGHPACGSLSVPSPQISLSQTPSPPVSQHLFTKTFNFNLVSSSYSAENVFIYFPANLSVFSINSISYNFASPNVGQVPILQAYPNMANPAYYICELGRLGNGGLYSLDIQFQVNSCNNEDINYQWGWNCNGYPTDVDISTNHVCSLSNPEQVLYELSQVTYTNDLVVNGGVNTYGMCRDEKFVVTVNSDLAGGISDIKVNLNLPPNLQLSSTQQATLSFCPNSNLSSCGTPIPIVPMGGPTNYTFNLATDVDGYLENDEQLVLTFYLRASCGYVETDKPIVTVSAQKYCEGVPHESPNLFTSWTHNTNPDADQCTPTCVSVIASSFCNEGSSILTSQASGGLGNYTYEWNPGAETTDMITVASPGTYTVTVTDGNSTATATVVAAFPPPISITNCPQSPIPCNQPFTFTADIDCAASYLWDFGDNTTSTDASPSHIFAAEGAYIVKLTVTCENGCISSKTCEVTVSCPQLSCAFCSFNMEGWGSSSNTTEPQPILQQDFAAVFPSGLTIGCANKHITFSSADAVRCFLPYGGSQNTALPLTMDYTDPYCASPNNEPSCHTPTNYNIHNSLLAEIVALNLNVYFDLYDPNFSPNNPGHFADLIITGNPVIQPIYFGMSVMDVLTLANKYIGGCQPLPQGYTAANLQAVIHQINVSFEHCHHTQHGQMYTCDQLDHTIGHRDQSGGLQAHVEAENGSCLNQLSATIFGSAIGGTPPYTYEWGQAALGTDRIIGNLADGTYILTVTDADGNISTASAAVITSAAICCTSGNSTFPQFPTGLTVVPHESYNVTFPASIESGFYESMSLADNQLFMSEGLALIVHSGVTLTIDNSTLEACGHMWKGLVVENGATLIMSNSSIKDAEYGIYALDGAKVYVYNCQLTANVVGIKTGVNENGTYNDVDFIVAGTSFFSGQLRGAYPGQESHGTKPRAGIEINNMIASIGDNTLDGNSFTNLNCGIISHNSHLTVRNSRFLNIHNENFYAEPYMGSAVVSTGEDGLFDTQLYRYVNENAAVSTLDNCDYGMYGDDIKFTVRDCKMFNMRNGVYATHCDLTGGIDISHNTISASNKGVELYQNEGAGSLFINSNSIITTGNGGVGIAAYEAGNGDNHLVIGGNDIFCNGSQGGIDLTGCFKPLIWQNHIYENVPGSVGFAGITLNGCEKPDVFCNHVNGLDTDTVHNSVGIRYNVSNYGTLGCNVVDMTTNGIAFYGPCKNTVEDNEMNRHHVGIYLNSNAYITEQYNTGNRWIGSFSSGFGADNRNTSPAGLSASKFTVHTGISTQYYPWIPADDVNWFTSYAAGTPFSCTDLSICPQQSAGSGEGRSLETPEALDFEIANDNDLSEEFIPETKSISKEYLYQRLSVSPELMSASGVLQNFYDANTDLPVGKLQVVKDGIQSLTNYSVDFAAAVSSMDDGLQLLADSVIKLDSISDGDTSNAVQYAELKSGLRAQATVLQNGINTLKYQAASDKANSATTVANANDGIAATRLPELNDRIVNGLYLQSFASRNYTFGESDAQTLLSIAQQCPYAGGRSVYRARVMYYVVDPRMTYDDYNTCLSQGIYRPQKPDRLKDGIGLVPNPANDRATVFYPGSDGDCVLHIADITGKETVSVSLPCDKKQYEFSVADLVSGIYFISVTSNGNSIGRKKLVVVR
jgi:PKD repeat protein